MSDSGDFGQSREHTRAPCPLSLQDDSILLQGKSINLSPLVRLHCKFKEVCICLFFFFLLSSFLHFIPTKWSDLILAKTCR